MKLQEEYRIKQWNFQSNLLQCIQEGMTAGIPEKISGKKSRKIPERIPEGIPEHTQVRIPEEILGGASQEIPG